MTDPILIGKGLGPVYLLPAMANRHGLVAGATGTGKTVTLHRLAESFSRIGVPVFMADVKGDLAGIGQPGGGNAKVEARVAELGLGAEDFSTQACPVTLWDILGDQGHPVRTTLSEMGPLLLARLLGLNETQEGVLNIVFRLADDNGWLLLDVKDLRALLTYLADDPGAVGGDYGHVSKASVGAIQRKLLTLEEQGAGKLFGEPALDIADLMQTDERGGATSTCWRRTNSFTPRPSTRPSCCGCCRSCSSNCPRWATSTSRAWSSSSMRPTCSSTAPPRCCWTRSSRWCA